jgi:REP element-mobilizing transposase RayT
VPLEKFPFKIEKQFRLKNWDYSSSGFYFITICTHDHTSYFGKIINNNIELNQIGKIAFQDWINIPNHFQNIILDEFIIMPNHVHGILIINNINMCRNAPWRVHSNNDLTIHSNNNKIIHPINNFTNNNFNINKNAPRRVPTGIEPLIPNSISSIINHFKGNITKFCKNNNLNFKWQPKFHDRVIRSEKEYYIRRQYIKNNPKNWGKTIPSS